jgi:hypothetical protein
MAKIDYRRASRRETYKLRPKENHDRAGWTHVKRQPVKVFSEEEIAAWIAERGFDGEL